MKARFFSLILTILICQGAAAQQYVKPDTARQEAGSTEESNKQANDVPGRLSLGLTSTFSGNQSMTYSHISWQNTYQISPKLQFYTEAGLAQPLNQAFSGESSLPSSSPVMMLEGGSSYKVSEDITLYGAGFYEQQTGAAASWNEEGSQTYRNYGFSMGMDYEVSEDVHVGFQIRHNHYESRGFNAPYNNSYGRDPFGGMGGFGGGPGRFGRSRFGFGRY